MRIYQVTFYVFDISILTFIPWLCIIKTVHFWGTEMNFRILESRKFTSSHTGYIRREVKDYEIDMECINGRVYSYEDIHERRLSAGDILVRRPHGVVCSVGAQNTNLLTLDFSNSEKPEAYSRNVAGDFQPICENELITRLDAVIHPMHQKEISAIYQRLACLSSYKTSAATELVSELIYTLNAEMSRKNYEILMPDKCISDKVISFMQDNLSRRVTLDDLSKHLCLERSYLLRLFRSETGKTPIDALIEMRLNKACDLVASTDLRISEIAIECGYNTVSFFVSEYKKRFGSTPAMHRELIKLREI